MSKNYFDYKGKRHYIGTIVEIREESKKYCGFNSTLKFIGYNIDDDSYSFVTLYDAWRICKLSAEQISLYIKEIIVEGAPIQNKNKKIESKYIEGIVSAWIWYILIMFFALFLKGIENTLLTWIAATFIFFRWRHIKMNGG